MASPDSYRMRLDFGIQVRDFGVSDSPHLPADLFLFLTQLAMLRLDIIDVSENLLHLKANTRFAQSYINVTKCSWLLTANGG